MRFLAVALPLLLLILAVFAVGAELAGLTPFGSSVGPALLGGATRVPVPVVLGTWLLEAIGLLALFVLLEGRSGSWWLDGLVTGWIGWIFRGPLVVVTVLGATNQRPERWWALAFAWFLLYTVCGLALALLARRPAQRPAEEQPEPVEVEPEPVEPVEPESIEPVEPAAELR